MVGVKRVDLRARAGRLPVLAAAVVSLLVAAPASASDPPDPAALAAQFFRNARFTGVEISPGARRIAVLFSRQGREMIVVRDMPSGQPTPIVELPDPEARLRWLAWVNDTRLLFGVEEPLRTGGPPPRPRRSRLYAINADGSGYTHLARNWAKFLLLGRGDFQYEDNVVDFLAHDPDHVLVAVRKPGEAYPGVYRLDVASGGLEPTVNSLDGVTTWHADHRGVVRAGSGYEHKTYRLVARRSADVPFTEIASFSFEDAWVGFEGFGFDPDTLYLSKAGDGGLRALYEYDLESGELGRRVYAHERFDVPGWLEYDDGREILTAVGYLAEGPERFFLDPEAEKRQRALDAALPASFNRVVSESADRSVAIVLASSDVVAPAYYWFEPEEKKLQFLFERYPALAGRPLAQMQAVSYPARDGRTIPAYLTLPLAAPGEDLPAVVLPHGGPTSRDVRGFDREAQYLAALGFAVLQPNFRGSTGYGSDHLAAGFRQWGLAMQDDLTAGRDWLVETGVADPRRVCIYGSSYGGYAALMGLIKTPDRFRCGAAYAAPADLVMLLNHQRGYLFSDQNVPLVGSTTKDRQQLNRTSPLDNVDKIRGPVFLAHGEDDDRVHVAHTQKLAKALKQEGRQEGRADDPRGRGPFAARRGAANRALLPPGLVSRRQHGDPGGHGPDEAVRAGIVRRLPTDPPTANR